MLDSEAQYTGLLDEAGLPGLTALCPGEERDVPARLVAVPERYRQWRPARLSCHADHADMRLGEKFLTLLLGQWSGHACSLFPTV
jgi:hypothetical protein